jgi:cation/acetate symporter
MPIKPSRWRVVVNTLVVIAVLTLAMALADLLGAPKSWVNGFFLIISIAGYAVIGMLCRTSSYSEYFSAGRRIPAPFNGMATAADWMSAASFIGLTGVLLSDGFVGNGVHPGGMAYLLGWTGAFCLLGFLFAGKLNEAKVFTVPELLGRRFNSPWVRWLSVWGAVVCSSVYLVAQIYGVGLVTSMLSGLTFELGVFLTLGGVLLCSFLGGMRAVTWTQVVQCVVIVVSMLALAAAVSWKVQGHPLVAVAASQSLQDMQARIQSIEADPAERATRQVMAQRVRELDDKIADPVHAREVERAALARQIARAKAENAPLREIQRLESLPVWREAGVERLVETWREEREALLLSIDRPVGFQTHGLQGLHAGWINTLALMVCLILGGAAMPHILMRSYTVATPQEAERSMVWALFFVVVVYLCASALAVIIKSSVLTELVGAHLDQLPEWAHRLKARKLAMLEITDYNQDGIVQYADIHLLSDYLILGVTEIMQISPVLTGLIAAGAMAAALSTADGLLLTISNALSHDLYFQSVAPKAPPLRQVMLSKMLLMLVALVAAWVATNRPVNILFWVTCAFSLAAATFFPVLLLGLYWSGMRRSGAVVAMASGFLLTFYYITINHPAIQVALDLSPQQTIWWGLEPICAGAFGVPLGLVSGVVVSWVDSRFRAL